LLLNVSLKSHENAVAFQGWALNNKGKGKGHPTTGHEYPERE
jgi:hypothetical protein